MGNKFQRVNNVVLSNVLPTIIASFCLFDNCYNHSNSNIIRIPNWPNSSCESKRLFVQSSISRFS